MSVLPILQHPHATLRKTCERVDRFDSEIRDLAAHTLETMYAAKGRGLAAPQVDVPIRLFVMDAGWKDGERTPLICANPSVVALGAEVRTCEEQCLSIPDHPVGVTRPARVVMRWHDLHARAHETELSGAAAVIARHEADHLEGRQILDFIGEP